MQPSTTTTTSTTWMLLAASYSVWVITILWTVLSLGGLATTGPRLFNWHPVLASGAVLAALTPGILARTSPISDDNKRNSLAKLLHPLCVLLAFIVLSIAVTVVYTNHVQTKQQNFYSLHSWLGVTTLFLMKGNIVAGIVSTFFPRFQGASLGSAHRRAGLGICFLSFMSATLGFAQMQNSLARTSGGVSRVKVVLAGFLGVATLCIGAALILLLLNEQYFRRQRDQHGCALKTKAIEDEVKV